MSQGAKRVNMGADAGVKHFKRAVYRTGVGTQRSGVVPSKRGKRASGYPSHVTVGRQDVLFAVDNYMPGNGNPRYDVTLDDQRFVMLRITDLAADTELILVQNFFEELKRLVPN